MRVGIYLEGARTFGKESREADWERKNKSGIHTQRAKEKISCREIDLEFRAKKLHKTMKKT